MLLLLYFVEGCGETYTLTVAESLDVVLQTDAVGEPMTPRNDVVLQIFEPEILSKYVYPTVNLNDYQTGNYQHATIPGSQFTFYVRTTWTLVQRFEKFALVKQLGDHEMSIVMTLHATNDTPEQVLRTKFTDPSDVRVYDVIYPNFSEQVRATDIDAGPYGVHLYAMKFGEYVITIEAVNGPHGDETMREAERDLINTLKENNS